MPWLGRLSGRLGGQTKIGEQLASDHKQWAHWDLAKTRKLTCSRLSLEDGGMDGCIEIWPLGRVEIGTGEFLAVYYKVD